MSRYQSGFMPLYPRETNKQSQYRNTQAQSSGGVKPSPAPQSPMATGASVVGGLAGSAPNISSPMATASNLIGSVPQLAQTYLPSNQRATGQMTLDQARRPGTFSAPGAGAPMQSEAGRKYVRPMATAPATVDRSSPVWQGQYEQTFNQAMQADRQRQIDDANRTVDDRLAARQGFYATPQQRQSGFFARGMGPMAGDAAIMERQNQPLGDGGPAAYAARSDQNNRRMEAERAMGGASPDGLTRFMPNQDLLQFANQVRAQEDTQRAGMLEAAGLGGGTSFRQPLQAMTPSEIQFYRHKMNMVTNPAYANRVNQNRAERQDMLANRQAMIQARRMGALDAAGASQQMRNLQAGRGAIGPGQDGMAAMMSLAAMQDPNAAMARAPGMINAQNEPLMRMLGFGNQMALNQQQQNFMTDMMDKRSQMQRSSDFRQAWMDLMSRPDLTPSDRDRGEAILRGAFGMGDASASVPGSVDLGPFANIPKPNIDPSTMTTEQANLAIQQHLDIHAPNLTPEQRQQYLREYNAQLNPVQRERALRDSGTLVDPYQDPIGGMVPGSNLPVVGSVVNPLVNWFLGSVGLDGPTMLEQEERRRRIRNNP